MVTTQTAFDFGAARTPEPAGTASNLASKPAALALAADDDRCEHANLADHDRGDRADTGAQGSGTAGTTADAADASAANRTEPERTATAQAQRRTEPERTATAQGQRRTEPERTASAQGRRQAEPERTASAQGQRRTERTAAAQGGLRPPHAEPREAAIAQRPEPRGEPAADPAANAPLEAALRGLFALPVRVTLTDNRRTMISLERRVHVVHIRLHHMFARADATTLHALGNYLASADREAAQQIGRYIEQQRASIRGRRVRPVQLSSVGLHHNLLEIYQAVNAHYFADRVQARITWSRDVRIPRARSIKLGSYTARDKLIRVHPALDAAFVPRFFVEYIVYHEMLHHVLPPRRSGKRRSLHGPEFQARERDFVQFEAALRWERENLERLLSRR